MSAARNTEFSVAIVGKSHSNTVPSPPPQLMFIPGAGVAGLALAMGLHKKGISFTLYEEAKEYSVVGAGIGCPPNGLRAMDAIEPGFRSEYEKICVGNKSKDAQDIFFEGMLLEPGLGQDQPWYGKSGWGHPDFDRKSAHRKALLDIMTSFIPIENVKFSKRLTDIEQHSDKVVLSFVDQTSAEANIVVGGDGIQSTVRKNVLEPIDPSQVQPVYANSYCYRAVLPMVEAYEILGDLTDTAKFFFGHGRGCVTYRISGGEEFNILLCKADPKPWGIDNAVTEKVTYEEMMADFEGPGVDERLRRLLSLARPIKWGLFHHLNTSTYCRGRAVLIGDSAHASLPFQANGAAQGLEDTLVLSEVLARLAKIPASDPDQLSRIETGLEAYDSVRRPRAQKQLEKAAEVGRMLFLQHEIDGDDISKLLPRLQVGHFEWIWFHDINKDVETALNKIQAREDSPIGTPFH